MGDTENEWGAFDTPFDALGGEERIRSIVDGFYDIIDADAPVLRAMLPRDDSASRDKLYAYLVEWTGGPELYTPERGHPRMRMRHAPFSIGRDEVETWLRCFAQSLDENKVDDEIRVFLDTRIATLAYHMQNNP
jgi:hemoglobin